MSINYIAKINKKLKNYITDVKKFKDILYQNNAYIAGGFILSSITDFFESSDIDIYVSEKHFNSLITDIKLLGGDIYQFNDSLDKFISDFNNLTQYTGCKGLIVSSEYDSSFFKKNNIKFKVEVNFKNIKCDIMVVGNNKKVLDIVKNFDLTCCQLWYNGKTFDGTHIKETLNKQTYLNADYVMSLIYGNTFIKKRLDKYTNRGFEVILSSTKYNSKPIIKTISNIDVYIVKIIICFYINYLMYISFAIFNNHDLNKIFNYLDFNNFFLYLIRKTNILILNNNKTVSCINKCKLYFKLLETNKHQYKVIYNILLEYCNSFRTFSVKELFFYTFMYFGIDFKITLTFLLSLFKSKLTELNSKERKNYYKKKKSDEEWQLRVKQNEKIIAHIESILADKSDNSSKILLKDQLKTIKDDFNLNVDTFVLNKAKVNYIDLDYEGYDVIAMESTKISEHIGKDHKNICFISIDENNNINYNNISFTTLTNLSIFFMDMNSGWFYKCNYANSMLDIDKTMAYVKIPLNYNIYVPYMELYRVINKKEQIIFFQKTKTLNNTVTHDNAYPQHHLSNPNHVSAYHCQTGSNIDVYTLLRYDKSVISTHISTIPSKNKAKKGVKSLSLSRKGIKSLSRTNSRTTISVKYVLFNWIVKDKIDLYNLSQNPNAIDLLKERIEYEKSLTDEEYNKLEDRDKINWYGLSENPNGIDLLRKRIEYEKSLTNEEYNKLKDRDKIDWSNLSKNPNAIDLLKKNQDKIDWNYLSKNPNAIDLLKERIEYENSLTNEELDELQNKIDWLMLSKNPNAIELLKNNIDKINWRSLSSNPNAINLLKENIAKINWIVLSRNPAIFKPK